MLLRWPRSTELIFWRIHPRSKRCRSHGFTLLKPRPLTEMHAIGLSTIEDNGQSADDREIKCASGEGGQQTSEFGK